jgi:bacillopeptidase F (M6 metalloprotease family)
LPSPLWASEVLAICSGDSFRPVREADILALLSSECRHPADDPAVGKMLYSGLKVSRIACSRARTSSLVAKGIKTKIKVKDDKPYLVRALIMT